MIGGVLSSAVSGLNVNAQRVAAAADNIVNVSTANYKPVEIQSKTIFTQQTSGTLYSPGGVLATTRQLSTVNGVQAAGAYSQTDIGTEFANLIQARIGYSASLKIISGGEDMAKSLMDIRA